jgi:hypothetical protein
MRCHMRGICIPRECEMNQDIQFKAEGLSWLLKNSSIKNPVCQEMLVKNIERASLFINTTEMLVDYKNKKMHIFLDLSLIGKILKRRKKLARRVAEIIHEGFPDYSVNIYFQVNQWSKVYQELLT